MWHLSESYYLAPQLSLSFYKSFLPDVHIQKVRHKTEKPNMVTRDIFVLVVLCRGFVGKLQRQSEKDIQCKRMIVTNI